MLRLQSKYSCILDFNKKNWLYSWKNSSMPLYSLFFLTKMVGNFWLSLHISFICEIAPDPSGLEADGIFLTFSLNVCLISIPVISAWDFLLIDKSIFQRIEMNWAPELRHTDTLFQKSDTKRVGSGNTLCVRQKISLAESSWYLVMTLEKWTHVDSKQKSSETVVFFLKARIIYLLL